MTAKKKITPVTPINTAPAKPKTIKIRFAVAIDRDEPKYWGVSGQHDHNDNEMEENAVNYIDNAVTQFVELEIPIPQRTPTLRYKLEN